MAISQGDPIQLPADSTENSTRTEANIGSTLTVTHIHTLKKITSNGTTGSITIINGKVTAFTRPT